VRRLALAFVLLLGLAGCGGGGGSSKPSTPAPSLATLFTNASSATSTRHSAHYAFDLTVSVETSSPLKNALLQAFVANPIKLHFEGDASAKAFTADGSISVTGRDFSGKLIAGQNELYTQLLGTWYGTKQSGIGSLLELGRSRLKTVPGAKQSSLQLLRKHAAQILNGTVSDGPTLDGAATWEFKGTFDANGLAKVSEQNGQTLTARQQDALQAVQDATDVTIDVGRDDHLLRRVDLGMDLNSDALNKLKTSGSQLKGISALHISFGIDLSKWGETVTIAPPENYKPLTGLTSSFGLGI
jgi:hypothetical protein